MLVDSSKSAFDNMLALLNTTNGTEYTAEDVSFGIPEVYSDAAHPDFNTKIVLTGIGEYSGTMDLFYTRLDLDREIMYRNYEGGSFADLAAFMTFLQTRNDVRGDNVRLEISYVPDGTAEVTTHILPIENSMLYFGQREIVFHIKAGYVPPVADPAMHYDVDIPAGTLNDFKQDFASTAKVVGSIEFTNLDNGAAATLVEYTIKPEYTEVQGKVYPMAVLVDGANQRLAVLGKTMKDGLSGEYYTRLVSDGEAPFTTARIFRALSGDALVTKTTAPKTTLATVGGSSGGVDTRSYGFGSAGLGNGISLGNGLWACLRITKTTDTVTLAESYELNYSITNSAPMEEGVQPPSSLWAALGERVLGGVEFLNAAGAVIHRIDAPTYGIPVTASQAAFWNIVSQIDSIKVEMVSIKP